MKVKLNNNAKRSMNNRTHTLPLPDPRGLPQWRAGWRPLLPLITGFVLAAATQTVSFAQESLNLIDVYFNGGFTMSGAGALGLPGDVWQPINGGSSITLGPLLDVQGNATAVTVNMSGGTGWGGTDPLDPTDATVGVLGQYTFSYNGVTTVTLTGLIPNTNYVVINYGNGNGNGQGSTITWVNDAATVTNSCWTTNANLLNNSHFVDGQNFDETVMASDTNGTIVYENGPGVGGNGWVSPWNGLQIQVAPNIPVIYQPPANQTIYAGHTVHYATIAAGIPNILTTTVQPGNPSNPFYDGLAYQWQANGANLNDGGGISGSQTPVLVYANVPAGATTVSLIVSNQYGTTTNSSTLTGISPTGYSQAVNAANPAAYWRLNDSAGSAIALDYINGLNGRVLSNATLGATGVPTSPYSGFEAGNTAGSFVLNETGSAISVPPLNLNTNTVTITAWVYPNGPQDPGTALLLTRVNTKGAGLLYGPATDTLGYVWNNGDPNTSQWNSGVTVPEKTWSFVALVVEPSRATVYVYNNGSLSASVDKYGNANEPWTGSALIGDDPADTSGTNNFDGSIADVAVFGQALSCSQIYSLYGSSLDSPAVAPSIIWGPGDPAVSLGGIARFHVVAIGSALNYQWQSNGVALSDNGHVTGSRSDTLDINGVVASDAATYTVTVSGSGGSPAMSSPAILTLSPRPLLVNIAISADHNNPVSGAQVLGQAGDVWNEVVSGGGNVNSASKSFLEDYSGGPTPLGFEVVAGGYVDDPNNADPTTNNLMAGYADGTEVQVTISGLNPNAAYEAVYYSADNGSSTSEGSTFSGGGVSGVVTGGPRDPLTLGANYFINTNISDASGNLSFTVVGSNGILNGIQLQTASLAGLPPFIGIPPLSGTVYSTFSQTFVVRAASDPSAPITSYQWELNNTNILNNARISGANSPTLTINPVVFGDAGSYTVTVSNANGQSTSLPAALTVLNGATGIHFSPPAPIIYSPAYPHPSAEATLLAPPGLIVGAEALGGTAETVYLDDSNIVVNFVADGSVATLNPAGTDNNAGFLQGGNTTGNTNFDEVLDHFNYPPGGTLLYNVVTLENLTAGIRYSFQWIGLDDRGGPISLPYQQLQDTNVAGDVSAEWHMGDNVYVLGSFTAAGPTFNFNVLDPPVYYTRQGKTFSTTGGSTEAVIVRVLPPNVSIVNNKNGTVTVTWDQTDGTTGPGTLYSAPSVNGPWTSVSVSGSYTTSTTGPAQFFRAGL